MIVEETVFWCWSSPFAGVFPPTSIDYEGGNVEKSRQRGSRHFAVLTYSMYAPRVKMAAAFPSNDSATVIKVKG